MYDVLVIGAGMMGAAAARHLSRAGTRVAVLGPAEPRAYARHGGVFASHYDAGRVTRILDPDDAWACLAERSIAAYPEIEAASGIRFHTPCGYLRVGPRPTTPADVLARVEAVGRRRGVAFDALDADALKRRFPFFCFREGSAGLFERGGAGYVNPRVLVEAQLTVAQAQGAVLVREVAVAVQTSRPGFVVETRAGGAYRGRQVLVAAGAFTNSFALLDRKLALETVAETVVLARVDPTEAEHLREMPSLWYDFDGHPAMPYVYAVPPVRYPDGHTYLKLGANRDPHNPLRSFEQIARFFRAGGDRQRGEALWEVLHALVPGLRRRALTVKPCILAYTPHGRPMIGPLAPGLFVAAGGCGASAKSSDAIGGLAAELILHGAWTPDLDPHLFRPVLQ